MEAANNTTTVDHGGVFLSPTCRSIILYLNINSMMAIAISVVLSMLVGKVLLSIGYGTMLFAIVLIFLLKILKETCLKRFFKKGVPMGNCNCTCHHNIELPPRDCTIPHS